MDGIKSLRKVRQYHKSDDSNQYCVQVYFSGTL